MENIALSDSNDDLTNEIINGNNIQTLSNPRMTTEQQVTSELQDAANTDVIKGIIRHNYSYSFCFSILFLAPFFGSANTPFKPLFPAPTSNLTQIPSSGSPLVFQQLPNNMSTLNPLLQPPTNASQLSSPLIQPSIRPPSMPSAFQPASSAFTPLNPANTQLTSSLIQPRLTIGNQPVQFPLQKPPLDTTNIPPPTQDFSMAQYDSQLGPPPSLLTTIKDSPNQTLPPPPSLSGACK
jgi:hypothetical protein